jgi:hypothetical protein
MNGEMILCGDSLSFVIRGDGCKGVEAVLRTHSYEHMRHSETQQEDSIRK